ncbi:MAG: hypothetical protein EGP82_06935 [Odoribacter splanchnicus]|nr:hypothetical protein [Odoribacter splanchnicus]
MGLPEERLDLPEKTEKVKMKRGTGWNREAGRLFKTGRNQVKYVFGVMYWLIVVYEFVLVACENNY